MRALFAAPLLLLLALAVPRVAPAQGAVLIETAAGPVVFDPWVWESRGMLPVTATVMCQRTDGAGLWIVDSADPRRVNFWPLKTARPEPLGITLTGACVAMATAPGGSRLWLAMVDTPVGTTKAHSYVLLTEPGATSPTARLELFGLPQSMMLLPSEPPRHEQLLVTAWIPELNLGMLYTLDPSLTRVVQSAPMPGRPQGIRHAYLPPADPPAARPETPTAQTPAEVELDAGAPTQAARVETPAALSPSAAAPVAAPLTATPRASKGFKNPVGLLKGRMAGRVLDAQGAPVPGARVTVQNRRGQTWTAQAGEDGSWTIGGLPFGTYQASAVAAGKDAGRADNVVLLEAERRVDLAPAKPAVTPPAKP